VLAALLELAPSGVEQVEGDGYIEYAVYGAPGELPAMPEGAADIGGVRVHVSGEEVATDWGERWKRFHEPVLVNGRLFVRPPWTEPRAGTLDLVIDPGQAFGTGAHPTTRLSLELLLELEPSGSLADLGCGSGVLAIAAAKLGFEPVIAVDNEQAALDATRANALANGVELGRIEPLNLLEQPPPPATTVTANLTRPLLQRVAELLVDPPDALVASGVLEEEAHEVAAAFGSLRERHRLTLHGWSALVLTG
jgi:ribosomal protein L11 methyltransferase